MRGSDIAFTKEQPVDLSKSLITLAKLLEPVIKRQLEQTDIAQGYRTDAQRQGLPGAGQAMQTVGLLRADERPTLVMVTHDIEEALILGDHMAALQPRPGRPASNTDSGRTRNASACYAKTDFDSGVMGDGFCPWFRVADSK